jgi:mannose-6-phosphate isomerase-like protein (cupin superfamily)
MPVVHAADAVVHDMHGSRFTSYAAPSRGSSELCAWRLDVPAGTRGVPHTVTREEILFVLGGTMNVTLGDGSGAAATEPSRAGDAVVVPAGSTLRIENPGDEPAAAWVTTSAGLEAILPDGSRVSPPWTR